MYELMLDTANLEDLKEGLDNWPVVGVTSNPTILKEEGGIDVYARLREIKALCGKKRSLHVQVVSTDTGAILEEAHHILDKLGKDTFIKVPVSAAGPGPAIKKLAAEGVNVTATAIYSTMQGMLAVLAGREIHRGLLQPHGKQLHRPHPGHRGDPRIYRRQRQRRENPGRQLQKRRAGRLRLRERRAGRHRWRRYRPPGAGHDQHRQRGGRLPEGF